MPEKTITARTNQDPHECKSPSTGHHEEVEQVPQDNHHANPVSARHGLARYEFDPNYYGIWVLEKLGLAKKVQIAKFIRRSPDQSGSKTQMKSS